MIRKKKMPEKILFKGKEKKIFVAILLAINLIAYKIQLPVKLQLFLNVLSTIYLGCVNNINLNKMEKEIDKIEGYKERKKKNIRDSNIFICLTFLYLHSYYLSTELMSFYFNYYFSILGLFYLMIFIREPLGRYFSNLEQRKILNYELDSKYLKYLNIFQEDKITININLLNILSFFISIIPALLYFQKKHWILNNLFTIIFSIAWINYLALPNFKVGFIVLLAQFFYDYLEFEKNFVVSLAESYNIPIALKLPLNLSINPNEFFTLGIADIIIPGIFLFLCLKFDLYQHLIEIKNKINIKTLLFKWCFIGYIFGIIATFAFRDIFIHKSLLFLAPGSIFILLIALKNGFIDELFSYEIYGEAYEKIKDK